MSKREKILNKWKNNRPKEVPRREVEAILEHFFNGQYRWEKSSHLILQVDDLMDYEDYQPYGEISLPCKGGKAFKGFYVGKLLKVIEILGLWTGGTIHE